jgi:2-keto-4-pentenoate hydratase/2-oxohepta-3-ene-1,7-dioic acid hydratase in catechol pathway
MKLLRFGPKGQERPGLLDAAGRIRDLSGKVTDISPSTLANGLASLRGIDPESLPLVEGDVRLAEPVGKVGKFLCIGLNYSDHAAEAGMAIPAEPIIFTKATSAIIGPNDTVLIPPTSAKSDWEVELGVVIGREARYVTKEAALDHVAGLCVVNDLSEREYQLERGGTWDKGKGCDTFGPFGPSGW